MVIRNGKHIVKLKYTMTTLITLVIIMELLKI
jgi:hypothetical protein